MNFVHIPVEERILGSKGYLKSLRRDGKIPGIIHSHNLESIPVTLKSQDLMKAINTSAGMNVLLKLSLGDDTKTAMIENLQEDILKDGVYIHIDLKLISLDEMIEVSVPIVISGQEERVKDDGFVGQQLHELLIMSKPTDIPENIKVDVSQMKMGDSILVGDITLPAGSEAVTPADEMIVNITLPRTAAEDESEDEEEAAGEEETKESEPEAETE